VISLVTPLFRGGGPVEPQKEFRVGDADVSASAMAGVFPELHDEEGHGRIGLAAVDVPDDVDLSVFEPGFPDHLDRCADFCSEVIPADTEVVIVDEGSIDQHPVPEVGGNDRLAIRGELFHPGRIISRSGKVHQNIFPDSDGSVPVRSSLNCCVRCSVHDFLRSLSGVML
jgi:hypothetical protein